MKREQIFCDRCRKEIDATGWVPVEIVIDREPDPSGNGYVVNRKSADLCLECINHYVDYAVMHGETLP